jgi:PleD family two-component response regulator
LQNHTLEKRMHLSNAELSKKKVVILQCGDEKSVELIHATLEEFGCAFITSDKWEAACRTVAEYNPDLIVINLGAPDCATVENIKMIRNGENTKEIPVIIISSLDRSDLGACYPLNGREVIITKPIPVDYFIAKVKEEMRRPTKTSKPQPDNKQNLSDVDK